MFAALPEGNPFKHLEFVFPNLIVPVQEALEKSADEINILKEAIAKGDLATISEHLGINIAEVADALKGLETFIRLYTNYSSQLTQEIAAINSYVEMWNKVKETAVKDLAARLRVAEGEIRVLLVTPDPDSSSLFTVTLNRPMF